MAMKLGTVMFQGDRNPQDNFNELIRRMLVFKSRDWVSSEK